MDRIGNGGDALVVVVAPGEIFQRGICAAVAVVAGFAQAGHAAVVVIGIRPAVEREIRPRRSAVVGEAIHLAVLIVVEIALLVGDRVAAVTVSAPIPLLRRKRFAAVAVECERVLKIVNAAERGRHARAVAVVIVAIRQHDGGAAAGRAGIAHRRKPVERVIGVRVVGKIVAGGQHVAVVVVSVGDGVVILMGGHFGGGLPCLARLLAQIVVCIRDHVAVGIGLGVETTVVVVGVRRRGGGDEIAVHNGVAGRNGVARDVNRQRYRFALRFQTAVGVVRVAGTVAVGVGFARLLIVAVVGVERFMSERIGDASFVAVGIVRVGGRVAERIGFA